MKITDRTEGILLFTPRGHNSDSCSKNRNIIQVDYVV